MEQEKPFKTIEVIDSRTGQVCKVACMSCIRGHRSTSCGIPVCRSKVFWTVKRPGRPSNSCTCRYGSTGRCQCVVAKSACPHKPKKGEKRSIDCRCDEQGRFCCLLEVEHWDALSALQKPKVNFYASREALDARHTPPTPRTVPPTPRSYSVSTPQTLSSLPSTPGPPSSVIQSINQTGPPIPIIKPSSAVPRFGLMGVGAPLGGNDYTGENILVWEGQAPPAPREYAPFSTFLPDVRIASPTPAVAIPPADYSSTAPTGHHYQNSDFVPVTQSLEAMSMPSYEPQASTFDFDKLMEDYFNYQFPSAICQSCGLNGCSCRNCPAVMQNFESGSWAQGCGRKHVHLAAPEPQTGCCGSGAVSREQLTSVHEDIVAQKPNYDTMALDPNNDPTLSLDFDVDELKMLDSSEPMDFSEFLINDLEQPTSGCCCGGR